MFCGKNNVQVFGTPSSLFYLAILDRCDVKGSQGVERWSDAASEALKHFTSPAGRLLQNNTGTWEIAPIPKIEDD